MSAIPPMRPEHHGVFKVSGNDITAHKTRALDQDAERFAQLRQQAGEAETGDESKRRRADGHETGHHGTHEQAKSISECGSPGDVLLRSLIGEQTSAIETAGARGDISEVIAKVAERIMVSNPTLDAGREVRIELKSNVLPGTEIRISQTEGRLQVVLATAAESSADFLRGHEQALQKYLNERLGREVTVEVKRTDASAGEGDGRSRQRRDLADEQQDV